MLFLARMYGVIIANLDALIVLRGLTPRLFRKHKSLEVIVFLEWIHHRVV